MNLCTACRNGDTANCSGVALYTPAVYIPCDNRVLTDEAPEQSDTQVSQDVGGSDSATLPPTPIDHEVVITYTNDDDGIHLYCQDCGVEVTVGYMPSLGEALEAASALPHTQERKS